MFTLKRLISSSLFMLILSGTGLTQENRAPIDNPGEPVPVASGPLVTAAATDKRVRFVSPGTVVQLRLEVYNEAGQKLFDTELHGGNVLDWNLQDGAGQRLQTGSYACVLTLKSLSGRLSQRVGMVTMNEEKAVVETATAAPLSLAQQQTIGPVEANAAFTVVQPSEAAAITAVTHDGTEGQLTSTKGALTFRTGDLFSGKEVERLRITPEGNVGIGTDKPGATLDVAGTIRAERVLIVKPWQLGAANKTSAADTAQADAVGVVQPLASGTGTQDRIAKWIDNVGTLGDSGITELAGNIGIGTTTPTALLDVTDNTNHLKYSPATAKLTLTGPTANLTVNPGLRFEFNSDPDAALSYLAYSHDNISQAYDAYWNGAAWVSSHLGANFAVYKNASQLAIGFNAGTAKGSTFPTFNTTTGVIFSNTGSMGIGGAPASAKLYVNGNVGIGTTTPAQKLDVVGNIKASGSLTSATANVVNQFIVDTNTLVVDAANNRVGVGTLAPAVPLDVVGDINTSTRYNIAGSRVLSNAGLRNLFAGVGSGAVNTAQDNSFFGSSAGAANTGGYQNSFFGSSAGAANTSAQGNSFFGADAGRSNTGGQNNSFFGLEAGESNTNGFYNAFFGVAAGAANTTASGNSFFGYAAGQANITGTQNSFFGERAGAANKASSNSFFGSTAGNLNNTGENNSFFGSSAGLANTGGANNSFFGSAAGAANTASDNAFFGKDAGLVNTSGDSNSFFGKGAGAANTTAEQNSFFGKDAGLVNTTGENNSFFGTNAGDSNTDGDANAFFGKLAGNSNSSGSNNTFIGHNAGVINTSESNNTFLGANSNGAATITNATAIGANAVVTQSDSLVLGSGVKVGAGISAPKEKLHLLGGNLFIDGVVASDNGVILKSPDGATCAKLTISNAGALVTTVVACP